MHFLQSFLNSNHGEVTALHSELQTLKSDLTRYETTQRAGLFSEQITASRYKRIISKAVRTVGRLLRFKLDKEQVEFFLLDVLLDLNRFYCASLRFASKLLAEKSDALYKAALELLPGTDPIQLSLFGSGEYKVLIDRPTSRIPRKRCKEVEPIGMQLSLF